MTEFKDKSIVLDRTRTHRNIPRNGRHTAVSSVWGPKPAGLGRVFVSQLEVLVAWEF